MYEMEKTAAIEKLANKYWDAVKAGAGTAGRYISSKAKRYSELLSGSKAKTLASAGASAKKKMGLKKFTRSGWGDRISRGLDSEQKKILGARIGTGVAGAGLAGGGAYAFRRKYM